MPVRRSTVGPAGGYDGVEVALRSASGFAGALCGFVPRSSGQRGSEGVWWPVEMGLALERWRQWTVGPGHGVFRLPALGFLPRCDCGSAVFPRGPWGGRHLDSVQLVEGAGCGRSHPVALADGGILRAHKTAADGSCRSVGRPNKLAAASPLTPRCLKALPASGGVSKEEAS